MGSRMEMVFEFVILCSFALGCLAGGLAVGLWRCCRGEPAMPKGSCHVPESVRKSVCDMPSSANDMPCSASDMPSGTSDMSLLHLKAVYISRQGKKFHIRDACLKHKLERYEPCLHCMKDLALHMRKSD